MVMRIGGLASGINTDEIIEKLMKAERMPLDRMEQDKTLLEWQREGYREIYQKLYDMDSNLILDMKMNSTYNAKTVSSSNGSVVTATATSSTTNSNYNVSVEQLASSAIKRGGSFIKDGQDFDPNKPLKDQMDKFTYGVETGEFVFYTYKEDGTKEEHKFSVSEEDSLNDVLKRITDDDNNIRAFYDTTSKTVILETTRTGNYNTSTEFLGAEIGFDGSTTTGFFSNTLNIKNSDFHPNTGEWTPREKGGTDARFTYNGLSFESKENSYDLNGLTLELKGVSKKDANGNYENSSLTVTNNVDDAFDSIMKFVDKYNEIVEAINTTQTEEKYRDYKPLTDEQRKEMEDKEIELWEEKAKSGILRGDSILSSGLFDLRKTWYSSVETGGKYQSITQIGIKTSSDYMSGGKLIVDEDKLKEALRENPEDVYKLFSNSTDKESDSNRGLINRLEDSMESMMKKIEERAGKTTSTLENYTLGKRLKDLNGRISDFDDRLSRVETRYWKQFNAMEQAISRLNNQSAQLLSQFGGGGM